MRRPLIVGHKGAGWPEPENTLRSIERAIDIGVDAVEVDVRRSKDGKLILMHDSTLERTTNGKGRVDSLALSELKALDAGQGERIPTLQEAMAAVDGRAGLIVEIKEPETLPELLEAVDSVGMFSRIAFASAFHSALRAVKELHPSSRCEILLGCEPVNPTMPAALALDAGADLVFMQRWFLSEKIVSEAHARLIQVGAGTVNSVDDLIEVMKLGVDTVGSDAPGEIIGVLR